MNGVDHYSGFSPESNNELSHIWESQPPSRPHFWEMSWPSAFGEDDEKEEAYAAIAHTSESQPYEQEQLHIAIRHLVFFRVKKAAAVETPQEKKHINLPA